MIRPDAKPMSAIIARARHNHTGLVHAAHCMAQWIKEDMANDASPADIDDHLKDLTAALAQLDRFGRQVSKFITLATHTCMIETLAPLDLIDTVIRSLDVPSQVQIMVEGDSAPIRADPVLMRHAMEAVIDNALCAVGHTGCVSVTVNTDGTHARMIIRDTGAGLASAVAKTCTQPFVSYTYETGRTGSGLGLAIADAALCRMSGYLQVPAAGQIPCQFSLSVPISP